MIDILVVRGLGDRPGSDIENPAISTVEVALQRGRNEIDRHSGLQEVSITSVAKPTARLGLLVEVHDALMGKSWRGKVSGITHTFSAEGPYTEFTVERDDL